MQGSSNRIQFETAMNKKSSRSHTIFQLIFEVLDGDKHKKQKINLCDLAGNEKFQENEKFSKDRFKEMKNINLSLTTLGKVINMLADDASGYIPYRESKLTRVLQDSLSGLGQTFLIATVSPTSPYTEASYNTVEFAKRTSKIKTVLHDELDFVEGVNVVQHLKEEIKYLKGMLQMKRTGDGISSYVYRIKQLEKENLQLKESNFNVEKYKKILSENQRIKSELQKMHLKDQRGDEFSDKESKFSRLASPISIAKAQHKMHEYQDDSTTINQERLLRDISNEKESHLQGDVLDQELVIEPKTKDSQRAAQLRHIQVQKMELMDPESQDDSSKISNDLTTSKDQQSRLFVKVNKQKGFESTKNNMEIDPSRDYQITKNLKSTTSERVVLTNRSPKLPATGKMLDSSALSMSPRQKYNDLIGSKFHRNREGPRSGPLEQLKIRQIKTREHVPPKIGQIRLNRIDNRHRSNDYNQSADFNSRLMAKFKPEAHSELQKSPTLGSSQVHKKYHILSQKLESDPVNMSKYQEKVTNTNRELKFLENIEKELEILRQRRRDLGLMHDGKSVSKQNQNSELFGIKQGQSDHNQLNRDSLGHTLTSQKTMSKYSSLPLINHQHHTRNLSGIGSGALKPKTNYGSFQNSSSNKQTPYNQHGEGDKLDGSRQVIKAPDFTNIDYADDHLNYQKSEKKNIVGRSEMLV